ncbi:MAG: hypothetical protein O7G85_03175 [Planctomycetota bacterium]|nr:hypothetical protein [Planctomycetota bacterium]
MVGCGMSIFTIDKAPLVAPAPSLGTITAFRGFPWEGAIQPMQTYGSSGGEYFISRSSSTTFQVRQLTGPLTAPTLTDLGTVSIPSVSSPPNAPALGSTTDIDTIDPRPINAIYRNGSIWTTHDVNVSGRAACRWYEINPLTLTIIQSGTISDPLLSYYYGSIAVNANNDVFMGFSGSDANQFVGAYYTGRHSTDPAGLMADPILLKAGEDSYNNIDGIGRNRWGDYRLCSVDPLNDRTFFTVQEYALTDSTGNDRWATWIAELDFCLVPPVNDCNGNCIEDSVEIANETTPDCNNNRIPDSCDLLSPSLDCNSNGIPDECEDCNSNGIPDVCECVEDCDSGGPNTQVDVEDLLNLLANWGGNSTCDIVPPGGDGVIDVNDLLALLAAWGSYAP